MATRSETDGRLDGIDLNRYDAATYVVYAVAIVFFVFPILWVISMSLRPEGDVLTYPVQFIPEDLTLEAYRQVIGQSRTWLWNSTKVAALQAVGILLVCVPAAYAFSRFEFRGRQHILFGILLFQMISPVVIVIPMYSVMSTLGLMDTHLGLILLYVGLQVPFSTWLLKSYFDTIPDQLDDAARVDGCNRLQTLWHVLMPSMLPGVAVVVIFNFVFSWSEFVMAFTILRSSDLFTISVGVFAFDGQYTAAWTLIAAVSVLAILPLIIMFIVLQRYFIRGLTEGAVKG
ncbi:carbohydrate ABC transporter permease [Saliphagus infecundisoli]|uniref:Carbohydrate ABC transporter permease n=1 Tax=Saliphagus infecundisoli TaxID=1849069 RepID=A0ABD5QJQ9_9EURY|nr:carbohydrate ABC transporter permease [Saliphagus infecundisoli]